MKNIYSLSKNLKKPLGYKINTNSPCDICGRKGRTAFNAKPPKHYLYIIQDDKKACTSCAELLKII